MSSICKYKYSIFFSNRIIILLCGLFILIFFTTVFIVQEVGFAQEDAKEINLEENNIRIEQVREEIKEIQVKINNYETEVKAQQKKERTLKREIGLYNNKISQNKLEIQQTKLSIQESEIELQEIEKKIKEGEDKIIRDRLNLKNLIKLLYVYGQDSFLEILITYDNVSEFFIKVDAAKSLKDEIFTTIVDLKNERNKLESRDKDLYEQREDMGRLIQIKSGRNESIGDLKVQKNELLEATKGEEKQFQQLLAENKNILPSLRAELYDLQSLGNKIKFDDAYSAAKHIGIKIGIRPAYLLGILKVESDLGKNTGSGNWEDDMHGCYMRLSEIYSTRRLYYIKRAEDEKNAYLSIVNRLNIDPDSVKVSKEPIYGCGGAMGPAQFIPTTWIAYEGRVSAVLGHYPPNPWDLTDAMTAMAIKVSDIPGVVGGNYNAEYEAAGRYIGGANWRSKKSILFYPKNVMYWAGLYEKELN